jgi:hypothetical protein
MYDNVYEHSERPIDAIIHDDDLLDGWFISMRRKSDEEKKKDVKNAITKKHPKAGEIFMMANSPEHAQEIEKMNDTRAKIIKNKMAQVGQVKGLVRDSDIDELRIGS